MVDTFKDCYLLNTNDVPEDRFVKWKNNNHSCVILNVDGVEKKKKSLFDVLKITNILNLFNLVIY